MDAVDFWTACASNGIILDQEQMRRMERYHDELLGWNKRVNLISRKDTENVYERHILHSLAIVKYATIPKKARCLDVGSGGGLPGIPVKIARPDVHMLLLDSINKKVKVTAMLAQHTGLMHIGARAGRAEALADDPALAASFDIVMARAVAPLVQLLSWTSMLLKPDACILALKGGDLQEEIAQAQTKFPGLVVQETSISFLGVPSFKAQEKKLLTCRLEN